MNDFKKTVGMRLKSLRTLYGLKQSEISEMLGIEEKSYSAYETGQNLPRTETLISICEILETTPNTLLGFSEYSRMLSICEKYYIDLTYVAINREGRYRPLLPHKTFLAAHSGLVEDETNREILHDDEEYSTTHTCVLRPVLPGINKLFKIEYVILPWAQFENILFALNNRIDLLSGRGFELEVFDKLLYCQLLLATSSSSDQFVRYIKIYENLLMDAKKEIHNPLRRQTADKVTSALIQRYYDELERKRVKRKRVDHGI